ncbi:nitroreductase family protein [Flavobacterium sp. JP2137]|uniref:nitroreductase family protein n=1 Tax=Flavobacterium sp. JP2137 TaxID=3414510 RepID=UPI003D2FADED
MELLKSLYWRHATKKMNGAVVPEVEVSQIIKAARMAPTSSGLQPFEMILVKNKAFKERIYNEAAKQSQVVDCSHLLIFAAWDQYTPARLDAVFDNMEAVRALPKGAMDDFKNSVLKSFDTWDQERQFQHAARQAYIAFGMAIAAAAELKVDATPMEGFDNAILDALLGLEKKGLKSVTLLPLGYRDEENDWLAPLKKVRMPLDAMLTIIE